MQKLKFYSLTANILDHYRNIARHKSVLEQTQISLIKATKIVPSALTNTLTAMASRQGYSPNYLQEIQNFKFGTEGMYAKENASVELFAYFTETVTEQNEHAKGGKYSSTTSLNVISGAAQKYVKDGTELVDYYLAEYRYAPEEPSNVKANLGAAGFFGGIAVLCLTVSGIGTPVGAILGGASVITSAFFTNNAIKGSGKTSNAENVDDIKDVLMACFIHELVKQGSAKLDNNRIIFIEL